MMIIANILLIIHVFLLYLYGHISVRECGLFLYITALMLRIIIEISRCKKKGDKK